MDYYELGFMVISSQAFLLLCLSLILGFLLGMGLYIKYIFRHSKKSSHSNKPVKS